MRDALDRLWRIVATGFCFSVFGLGGLVLRIVVFPLVRWSVRDPERRAVRVKAIIRHTFRFFVGLMVRTGVLSLEVHGLDKLHRSGGRLVVANHPSLVDVVFLISFIDRADCIVKSSLARNPFTRGPVVSAGFLCNDEGEGLVDDCVDSVRRGNRLIIFPEGSRTPLNGMLPLQRGAARIAVKGEIDITPVRIRCQPRMLAKGVPWYRVPPSRGHFVIEVCDDIPIAPFLEARSHAIATRQLTDHLTDFFSLETRRAAT